MYCSPIWEMPRESSREGICQWKVQRRGAGLTSSPVNVRLLHVQKTEVYLQEAFTGQLVKHRVQEEAPRSWMGLLPLRLPSKAHVRKHALVLVPAEMQVCRPGKARCCQRKTRQKLARHSRNCHQALRTFVKRVRHKLWTEEQRPTDYQWSQEPTHCHEQNQELIKRTHERSRYLGDWPDRKSPAVPGERRSKMWFTIYSAVAVGEAIRWTTLTSL